MASSQPQLAAGFDSSIYLLNILETTKESLTAVPECYVRSIEQLQLPSDHSDKPTAIPTIDMIKLLKGSKDADSAQLENLHSTCKEWGVFQVDLNNYISNFLDLIDRNYIISTLTNRMSLALIYTYFFYVQLMNHGVSPMLLEKLKYEIEEFFKLPLEEKMKYQIRPGDVEGYGSIVQNKEQKRDWGNRFYMVMNPIHRRKPYLFPELPSSLRSGFSLK